jgi:predicted transcriptional regulator
LNETAKSLAEAARFSGGDEDELERDKSREDDISVIAVKLVK